MANQFDINNPIDRKLAGETLGSWLQPSFDTTTGAVPSLPAPGELEPTDPTGGHAAEACR